MVLPVRLHASVNTYGDDPREGESLRLDENLHLFGCPCLSNELNGGVVDKSKSRRCSQEESYLRRVSKP